MGSTNHIPLGVVKVIYFLLKIKDTCQTDCVVIAFRHCERPEGAWQSWCFQCLMGLLRSLHALAMTLWHSLQAVILLLLLILMMINSGLILW